MPVARGRIYPRKTAGDSDDCYYGAHGLCTSTQHGMSWLASFNVGHNALFCASEGLATVFRGAVDYQKLARIMKLPDEEFVTFAQTVGYPRT